MRTRTITTVIGIWSTMTNAFTLCTKWFRTIEFSHSHTSTIRHISVGMLFCRKSWIQWRSHQEPGKAGNLTLFSIFPVLGTSCLANGLWHRCQMSFRSVCSCANFRIMSAISSIEKGLPTKSFIYFVKGIFDAILVCALTSMTLSQILVQAVLPLHILTIRFQSFLASLCLKSLYCIPYSFLLLEDVTPGSDQ